MTRPTHTLLIRDTPDGQTREVPCTVDAEGYVRTLGGALVARVVGRERTWIDGTPPASWRTRGRAGRPPGPNRRRQISVRLEEDEPPAKVWLSHEEIDRYGPYDLSPRIRELARRRKQRDGESTSEWLRRIVVDMGRKA